MSVINVSVSGGSGGSTTATSGDTIDVAVGNLTLGTLPALQLAAGSGISISYANGTSTISSNLTVPANLADLGDVSATSPSSGQALTWNGTQWGAANVPVGTTLNGLSGAVTLVAGEGVNLAQNGQNITVSSSVNISNYATTAYVDAQTGNISASVPSVRDLTLIQTLDGTQHYSWMANDEYSQGYFVEIQQVNVTQNLDTAISVQSLSDGSLNIAVTMDTDGVEYAIPYSLQNGTTSTASELPFYSLSENATTLLLSNVYLSEEFTSPGNYPIFAKVWDSGGYQIGTTGAFDVPFSTHGNPVAPEILSRGANGMNVTAVVTSPQTPHQRGFYPISNMTYYLEINQNQSATTGWIRGSGVNSPSDPQTLTVTAPTTGPWFARAVASNPEGFGPPGDAV